MPMGALAHVGGPGPRARIGAAVRAARAAPERLATVLTWPAPAGTYRRLVDPLSRGVGVRARIEAVIPETPRAATVVLRPGAGWRPHRPGQWTSIGVDVDGVRHHRCYSITSLPADVGTIERARSRLTVTVQAVPGGTVSNHLVRDARPGDVVHLDGPYGDFGFDPDAPARPALFVTGGSGITPVLGMLRALDAGLVADRDVVVLHHAPSAADALFTDEIGALALHRRRVRSHLTETGSAAPPAGLELTPARLDDICPDWRVREAWACGPRPLLDAMSAAWADGGVDHALHVERFAPTVAPPATAVDGSVAFTVSGVEVTSDGDTTILDLAETAGLTPSSGCRMGVCHRCVVPLRSGTVRDLRDGRTRTEPGTHVQICVNAPVGDVEIAI